MDLPYWECLIEALHTYLLGSDPIGYGSSDVLIIDYGIGYESSNNLIIDYGIANSHFMGTYRIMRAII
jgi:hypothetical protein